MSFFYFEISNFGRSKVSKRRYYPKNRKYDEYMKLTKHHEIHVCTHESAVINNNVYKTEITQKIMLY